MKKIAAMILMVLSATAFSVQKTGTSQRTGISTTIPKGEDFQIENTFNKVKMEITDRKVFTDILGIDPEKMSLDDFYEAFFHGSANIIARSSEFRIKKIDYLSKDKANIIVNVRFRKINEEKTSRKAEEKFRKHTGYTIDQVDSMKLTQKEKDKYSIIFFKAILEAYEEDFLSSSSISTGEMVIPAEKINGIWTINPKKMINEITRLN